MAQNSTASATGGVAAGAKTGAIDVATVKDVDMLHAKAVGLIGVLFLTVTGAAPISAMLFNVPIAVGFGNGIGAPASFLFATIILTIFSVGYAAMARKVTAVGGFYSFISHGLGRELGMAFAFASVVAYAVFEASLAGGFAYFANLKLAEFGMNVPWVWLAFIMTIGIAILSYFDVKVSAAILGVALICEVLILLVFDFSTLSAAGTSFSLEALNPVNAFKGFDAFKSASGTDLAAGAAAIGLFFAFWSWVGFEMAPNYGEESRDPKRIVPLSLYISVIGLGIFYTITSWCATSAYPTIQDAIAKAQGDSAHFFLEPIARNAGGWAETLMSYLILTGAFACGMAFHNTCARYLYSLGREGVLPATLGRTHKVYKSPHIASTTQSVIAAIIIIIYAIVMGTDDPTKQAYLGLYGLMALLGTSLVLIAQAVVSIAIVVYFQKHHADDAHWFATMVAPIVSFIAQAIVIYLLFSNIDFLGGGLSFANHIWWIDCLVIILGIALAYWLRSAKPEVYDRIGRLIYSGLDK
jgi:amino acid transporter